MRNVGRVAYATLHGAGGIGDTYVPLCAGGFETRPYDCATLGVVA